MAINRKRIFGILIFFIITFLIIIIRLGYITFYKSNDINNKAYELWTREIPLAAKRGEIRDRNGNLIVGNELCYTLASINRQVTNKENTAKILSNILDEDYDKILKHLSKNNSIEIIKPEARKINKDEALKISNMNLEGIYISYDYKRMYPYNETLAQTLGFCGIDNEGLSGIEYKYNDFLKGQKGNISIYTDAKGNLMKNEVNRYNESTPGLNIYLTIDINLQKIIEQVLDKAIALYSPNQISALMINCKTGEILGMYSYPSFLPSEYQKFDSKIYNRNLPIFYAFEPGSTFKILTYSMAYEEKLFNLNERIYCGGSLEVAGRKIKCWKHGGHGSQTMLEGIENSCNVCFMELVRRIGVEKFYNYLKLFGMTEKTGIDLEGEGKSIIVNKERCGPVELATQGFGQSSAYTSIELAMAAISCVNGGSLFTPYILNKIETISQDILYENKPKLKRKTISLDTSNIMKYALESVCAIGTGRNAFVEGYRVGGKTGTAQVISENGGYEKGHYILSFLGMAPMNDPEIMCYVAIDKPKNCTQYGGVVTAPIVGEILEQSLSYLGIKRDYENQIEKNLRWYLDTPTYKVEKYIGKTRKEIKQNPLFKYIYLGKGDKVIFQSPEAFEKIKEGDSILIYLG